MIRLLLSRLLALGLTLLLSSFVVYGAVFLAPGDPIAALTGGRPIDPATLAILRAQYHLDQSFLAGYWSWLTAAFHGDFGRSVISQADVVGLISARVATTFLLVAYASVLILVFGVGLGIVAALKKGRVDTSIVMASTAGLALPSFVMAIVLISFFSVRLGWFPVFGEGSGLIDRLWHLTLPAIALAVSAVALVARLTRGALREELSREHVETARSRGIPSRQVIRKHVLRNGLIPITTAAGITVAGLVAGSVVVERAFNLNGLGTLLVTSVGVHDFPVVQGVVLLLVATFVILSTVVDYLHTMIDPRMKLSED